ncbi:hypothetical protein BST50_19095 [Vibrio vulnificus]|uniref:DUF6795 domain-containing protein n=1 Tax=Vibrio vulnificus TaxID=672 RepID=UPI000BA8B707|nr:DUF6795 domain-containing protein [Vibrio vulnificus]ELP6989251.1 hypothetical protein [Vibrio vulnificus]MCU8162930.1 hypothetical protein [Vibrio vulnificus]MCU8473844.1 hypothetical protein [Vibrio vulnificus]PAO31518.1 hypothetical protein BST49_14660 [Vibrio vulnificus]PAO39224.1 hypothetical protein BST50_19095 [Vibrio vulnificus]
MSKDVQGYQYTPKISGVLMDKGIPLENQLVILSVGLSASGRSLDFSTTTNSAGRFDFSPVFGREEIIKNSLIEHYVTIVLISKLDSENTVIIWEGSYDGYEIEKYLVDNMNNLICDITNPLRYFAFSIDEEHNDDYYVNSQCDLFGYVDSDLYGN